MAAARAWADDSGIHVKVRYVRTGFSKFRQRRIKRQKGNIKA
jgi:hypothetical protein